jgi:mono/diheme cytochrome c family protein
MRPRKEGGLTRFPGVRMHGKRKKVLLQLVSGLVLCVAAADLSGGLAAQATAGAANDQQAQIAKGSQAVGQTCAACHAGI